MVTALSLSTIRRTKFLQAHKCHQLNNYKAGGIWLKNFFPSIDFCTHSDRMRRVQSIKVNATSRVPCGQPVGGERMHLKKILDFSALFSDEWKPRQWRDSGKHELWTEARVSTCRSYVVYATYEATDEFYWRSATIPTCGDDCVVRKKLSAQLAFRFSMQKRQNILSDHIFECIHAAPFSSFTVLIKLPSEKAVPFVITVASNDAALWI